MKYLSQVILLSMMITILSENVIAARFEADKAAIKNLLGGSKKAKARKVSIKHKGKSQSVRVIYTPSKDRLVVIQKRIYEPDCTHTWAIGLDSKAKIREIRVTEMSCSHAYPTRKAGFLDQFDGKGPADVKSLPDQINTIAKATGSSNLTTDAVQVAILAADEFLK